MNHKKLIEISEEIVIHQNELKAIKKYAKILAGNRKMLLNVRLQMELLEGEDKKLDLFCDEVKESIVVMPIFNMSGGLQHFGSVQKEPKKDVPMFSVNYMPPDMALVMFEHMAKFHQYKIDLLQKEYAQEVSKSIPQIQKLLNQ